MVIVIVILFWRSPFITSINLDKVFTYSVSGTLSANISDHLPLFFNFSSNYSSNQPIKTNYLLKINVSTQNIINFTNDLAAYDWSTMKSSSDVNKAFNVFL